MLIYVLKAGLHLNTLNLVYKSVQMEPMPRMTLIPVYKDAQMESMVMKPQEYVCNFVILMILLSVIILRIFVLLNVLTFQVCLLRIPRNNVF